MQQHEKNQHFFVCFSYQKLGVRLIHVCAVYTRLYGTCSCGGPQKIIFLFFSPLLVIKMVIYASQVV